MIWWYTRDKLSIIPCWQSKNRKWLTGSLVRRLIFSWCTRNNASGPRIKTAAQMGSRNMLGHRSQSYASLGIVCLNFLSLAPKAQWTGIHMCPESSGDPSFPLPLPQHSGEQGWQSTGNQPWPPLSFVPCEDPSAIEWQPAQNGTCFLCPLGYQTRAKTDCWYICLTMKDEKFNWFCPISY